MGIDLLLLVLGWRCGGCLDFDGVCVCLYVDILCQVVVTVVGM